ncbi:phospholipase D-like domain-containing protein [Halomonas sp. H5]|uniref:phospholipase D-like domain-containing protein n=1 Tax=Halomonas sp. H5 TaxID=3423910 RepID=UPI003D35D130
MIEFYLKSIDRRWKKEASNSVESVLFLSPYVTLNTAALVLKNAHPKISQLHTVFSFYNFASGASSVATLRRLKEQGCKIFHLEGLHAKISINDKSFASIGSQNLTLRGTKNKEGTVVIKDEDKISELKSLVDGWTKDSVPITEFMLDEAESLIAPYKKDLEDIIQSLSISEDLFWEKLAVDKMRKKVPLVKKNIEKFICQGTYSNISIDVARYFARNSAWWLRHPSGRPVRAPGYEDKIYGESPDWRIGFGANEFMIGIAISRCLATLDEAVNNISAGRKINREDVERGFFYDITGAVANYEGVEYEGYYSAIAGGRDMVFGTQSIDIKDFIDCLLVLTEYDKIFL